MVAEEHAVASGDLEEAHVSPHPLSLVASADRGRPSLWAELAMTNLKVEKIHTKSG